MIELKNEKIAVPVVLFAGLLWSFGPLVVRYMEQPHLVPWQYIFGRGLTIFLILNLYLYFEEGLNFYKNYKKVKSTNDVAMKLIKRNILEPTLITTEKQTNGRGRIGKKWISLKGNLFITLFFEFDNKKINFKQFAVLNAFLLKKVISNIISKKIKIKWPNDLLFNKLKFCGILQEVIRFNNFDYLIVGIGLNTNTVPQNKSFKSTCLKNILNKKIDNQKILKKIVIAYEKFLGEKNKLSFSDLKMKYK